MQTSVKIRWVVSIGIAFFALPLQAEVLYMANTDGNNISAYHIEGNGTLKPVVGMPFPSGKWPVSMAVDLPGRFLFTANMYDDTVSAYRIDSNGVLTHLAESNAGSMPESLAVDPFGPFLYVTNLDGRNLRDSGGSVGHVSAYRIRENGNLTSVSGSPFPAGYSPLSVVVDPLGLFVYVANAGSGQEIWTETISGYRVEAKGVLKPLRGSPFPEGGNSLSTVLDPRSRSIYLANFYDPVLSAYHIGLQGVLTPVAVPLRNDSSSQIVVDPWGRFVYENSVGLGIYGYRIAANGVLTSLSGSPFNIGFRAGFMVIDLSGQFLYLGNGTGVSAYRILGNGALMAVTGSPFQLGFQPGPVVVSP
jgi:DNA-binding beta-propeller fold protein YncE